MYVVNSYNHITALFSSALSSILHQKRPKR